MFSYIILLDLECLNHKKILNGKTDVNDKKGNRPINYHRKWIVIYHVILHGMSNMITHTCSGICTKRLRVIMRLQHFSDGTLDS